MNTKKGKSVSKLTPEARQALTQVDESTLRSLLRDMRIIALWQLKRCVPWPGGRPGPVAADIAADAIGKIWCGEWAWDPNEKTLLDACSYVIRSLVSEEYRKAKRFQRLEFEQNEQDDHASSLMERDPLTEIESATEESLYSPSDDLAHWGLIVIEQWTRADSPMAEREIVRQLEDLKRLLPPDDILVAKIVDEIVLSYPERNPPKPGTRQRKRGWSNQELAETLAVSVKEIENAMKRLGRLCEPYLWNRFLTKLPNDGKPWVELAMEAQQKNLTVTWKDSFAQKHSLSVTEVISMGVRLLQLLRDWLRRTIGDEGVLQIYAENIKKNL